MPVAVLAAGCALLWDAHTQAALPLAGSLAATLPVVPGYEVTPQRISTEEEKVAGMSDYVARAYHRDGVLAFTTFVSYYDRQTQGRTIHSPRNCLPGAGWEIVSGGAVTVALEGANHRVNRYVLKKGQATAVAYYWYQGRGRVTANEYLVKWNLLRDAALLGRTEEALVRVVVPVATTAARGQSADLETADTEARVLSGRLMRNVAALLPRS